VKAYYQDSYCTIYHGDCREVLPEVGDVDLVLTDPPYGVGKLVGGISKARNKNHYASHDDTEEFVETVVVPVIITCIEKVQRVVLTPGSRCMWLYPRPYCTGVFYYPAGAGMSRWGFNCWQPILFYGKDPYGGTLGKHNARRSTEASDKSIDHPCPKPIGDWKWLLDRASKEGETILDPFMGSGTTLRAAKDLQRHAIGIELEEKYCEIAAKRLAQEVLAL